MKSSIMIFGCNPIPMLEFGKIDRKKFLVICGNLRQFEDFCNEKMRKYNQFGENQGLLYIYFPQSNPYLIRGIRVDGVIKYGTWYEIRDIDYLIDNFIYPMVNRGIK